jgi:uncharacterized membrane protein YbhN (UPF0104 family)
MTSRAAIRVGTALLALTLLCIWVDPSRLIGELSSANGAQAALAATSIFLAALLGGINVLLLVRDGAPVSAGAFFPAYWLAWSVGLVTPGQVGDMAVLSVVLKQKGFDWRMVLSRSVLDKVISAFTMAVLAAVALWRTGFAQWHSRPGTAAAIAAILLILLMLTLLVFRSRLPALREHARAILDQCVSIVRRRPDLVAINLVLTLAKLALTGLAYWFAFRALGDAPGLADALLLSTAAGLVAYLPLSFNGIGTVEGAAVLLFSSLGIAASSVVAAYLLLRACVLAVAWLPALGLLLLMRSSRPATP